MIARRSTLMGFEGKAWLLPALALPMMILVGCNGSNNGGVNPNPTATPTTSPTSAPTTINGNYRGNISGDATGTIELRIVAGRTISGTLNTTSFTPARNSAGIGAKALYMGTGSVGNNGDFSVIFRIGAATATFRGRIAVQGNTILTQNLTWSTNSGQDGTFTLQTVIGGSPTVTPIPGTTGTPAPTATAGGGTGACTTGRGSATFSANSAAVDAGAFSNACANGSITRANGTPITATLAFADARNGKARAVTLTILDVLGGVVAGRTYNVGLSNLATYNETLASNNTTKQWSGRNGTIRVTSLSGNNISLEFAVNYGPSTIAPGSTITPGTGTFTLTGSATGTLDAR